MQSLMQPIIRPLMDFGECLKGILEKRKVSGSELARLMAYKSRNSIFRILDNAGGQAANQAFFDRLMAEDPLGLTDDERAELTQAMEVSRVGMDAFLSSRAMRELLMDAGIEKTAEDDLSLISIDGETGDAMAEILQEAQEIDMLVIGCCSRKVFEAMRVRLRESGMDGRCRITHIICMDARQAVSNISAIRPMLYHPGYMAYCVEHGILSEERECLYRNNWIIARYRDGGAQRSRVFLLVEKGVFCSIEQSNANTYPMLNRIFAEDMKKMLPLKMNFASSAVTDYLAYIRECLKLEAGRAIYMIKLDVPLSCVHPDILLPMARAGFADMAQEDELEGLMAQMESVHRQRWDNLFAKRKPTHMIFSREAMEHFARTGRQSDHLHILDAYAPQARVQILENLRRQTMDNPNFSVHFFRQDFESPLTEVGLYEGAGVLLTKPYTHYDLSGDHAESIIREKEFCEQYKRFYTQDLLERCVLDGQETIRVLDELIEAARRQEAV